MKLENTGLSEKGNTIYQNVCVIPKAVPKGKFLFLKTEIARK